MVLARAAPPAFSPTKKAVMVAAAMTAPKARMRSIRLLLRMGSLGLRGFWSSRPLRAGSTPTAMAGRESVSRLMNSRWTGAKGMGRPSTEARNTHRIPAILPDSRKLMAFLMLV